MNQNKKNIKTFKKVYPQIYAYTLPERHQNDGWQKIGYTERKDVDARILEQTRTAAFAEPYKKLWSASAIYEPVSEGEFFNDHKLHEFLTKNGIRRDEGRGREWWFFNGTPEKSKELFDKFRSRNYVNFTSEGKIKYVLRPEQAAAVEMTLEYAKNHQTYDFKSPNLKAEFLWNAKPRFGKTLTTYDFAKKINAKNVLIVTNRPAIANSWFEDYDKFISGYYFISTADSLKEKQTLAWGQFKPIIDSDKKQFTFLSLQDLKGAKVFGGGYEKLRWVADLEWDLLVIDEAHEGVDTGRTDEAFVNIKRKFTLHLSGTPFRALANGKFAENQIFNWTYLDEQRAKKAEIEAGDETGAHVDMPDMRLFTYKLSEIVISQIDEGADVSGENVDYAFDLNEFFATDEKGRFKHESKVRVFLDRLSSNEKYPFSTPELRDELKHTFWWVGNRVASAKAMEKMLRNHPVFGDYEIILAAGDGRKLSDNDDYDQESDNFERNEKAFDRVQKAIKEHDKTITLSVGQLTTGVTVKEWSAVLMLTEIKSESIYTQAIFRSQNPHKYYKDGQLFRKKSAYVFDFSPSRVLETYDKLANSLVAKSAQGKVTEDERSRNVAELLNFFPVIAEDEFGKMVELDAGQVLTFPKAIMAQEVVKHRFMTNLLFRNIGTVYNIPSEIKARLNKVRDTKDDGKIAIQDTEIPDSHDRQERTKRRISVNRNHIFGQKIYGQKIESLIEETLASGALNFGSRFTDKVEEVLEEPYAKWIDTYNPTNQEISEMREKHQEKIHEIVDDFISSSQKPADKQEMAEKISDLIENDMPRDMVDEREEQEFESEEKDEMDMIKRKLKTFSRAIPSLVMASKDPENLTIDNIENAISDNDFSELFTESQSGFTAEPFTKEDFRLLRDGYDSTEDFRPQGFDGFFEKYVFNAAIQEFEKKRRELADYLKVTQKEDIFTYIPPQKTNQIFTPRRIVNKMLNILEAENPGIFSNPDLTFADLHTKSGLYIAETAKRLFRGLEHVIPDEKARIKHIFERQLYAFAPTQIIHDITTNYVYGGFPEISHQNIIMKDLTQDFKEGRTLNMKFDVVIGNPPYQEEIEGTSARQIYPFFMEGAYKISNKVCMITPARFLFNAGKTPKVWNQKMLDDKHLKVAYHEQDSANVFAGTDIKGGVAITYRDTTKDFGKIGTFTHFDELNSALHKVLNYGAFISIDEIYFSQNKFNLDVLYLKNPAVKNIVGSEGRERRLTSSIFGQLNEIFTKEPRSTEDLKIIGVIRNKRKWRYIAPEYLEEHPNLRKFKVMLPGSNGSGAIGEVLSTPLVGEPLVGEPLVGHTQTFISFGAFETREEAENLLKYIKTKFARTMLGTLKITQSNKKDTWRNVPLQDFTANSDIDWSKSIAEIDRQLYAKYGLSDREIAFIEEKVREM